MDTESISEMIYDDADSENEFEMMQLRLEAEQFEVESSNTKRGSVRRRTSIWRNHSQGHERLVRDYFNDQPVYTLKQFRRRFRMRRSLFLRIHSEVVGHEPYFIQRRNSAGQLGLSSLQKITAAIRMLAYGIAADFLDEYLRIAETTTMVCLKNDIAKLLAVADILGFPGMLGSIDCMHWTWKNCPTTWQGMYTGHCHEPTIILEAVSSYDLWIWHAFFGLPGSHNDINVLERSPIFVELSNGHAPPVEYTVNNNKYYMGYYLADGIYPQWATFVKTIPCPQGNKRKLFAKAQESCRKDVERAFGVLQARFAIVRGPARFWDRETLKDIMTACVILHNMIVEDERDETIVNDLDYEQHPAVPRVEVSHERTTEVMNFIERHLSIRAKETHSKLQLDL